MLKLKNLSKYYQGKNQVVHALKNINMTLSTGEFVVITGESGSGKSTLLNVISGLDSYEEGELFMHGAATSHYAQDDWERYRRNNIAFIFQNYNIIDAYSVQQNIEIALIINGVAKEKREDVVKKLIEEVGLTSHTHHKAGTLSNGQKQRVAIARALAQDAPMIIADEPTGNLDEATSVSIMKLLKKVSKDRLVVVVSHDYEHVKAYASRHIRLYDGQIVEDHQETAHEKKTSSKAAPKASMHPLMRYRVALKNILTMPKRTFFMLLIMLFIVGVFVFSFGVLLEQNYTLRGERMPNYLRNVSEHRLIVVKPDYSNFTSEELMYLANLEGVQVLVNHDVMFDLEILLYVNDPAFILDHYQSIQQEHADVLNARDLRTGRLPENRSEVVMANSGEYRVGDTIDIFFGDRRNDIPAETFTIVGLTKEQTGSDSRRIFYFHDDVFSTYEYVRDSLRMWHRTVLRHNDTSWELAIQNSDVRIDNTLPVGELVIDNMIGASLLGTLSDSSTNLNGFDLQFTASSNFYSSYDVRDVKIHRVMSNLETSQSDFRLSLNAETYSDVLNFEAYQITLVVRDYYDALQVMGALGDHDMQALYPAEVEGGDTAFDVVIMFMQRIVSLLLLFVMYFISYFALKNVMVARQKDFIILRSMGAKKRDLNRIILVELMITIALAFIIIMTFLIINGQTLYLIPNYLRYFEVSTYFLILGLLFILSVLLGRRFNSKMFSLSIVEALRRGGEDA